MGGCYESGWGSSCESSRYRKPAKPAMPDHVVSIKKFFRTHDVGDLVQAYTDMIPSKKGFIKALLDNRGVSEAPKEFCEWEYEVKLDLAIVPPQTKAKNPEEPGMKAYLDAFIFPAQPDARFLKDPAHAISSGRNHFLGNGDEALVVIEKAGKMYLKEKGPVVPVDLGVPGQALVVKRTEKRWETTMDEILEKVAGVRQAGNDYKGVLPKEKADDFILDTNDGRIYSFTITRAQRKDGAVQRQLELEYAGYVPDFKGHTKDAEVQIISGMVDLARYVIGLHGNAPLGYGWRVQPRPTRERKFDFVSQKQLGGPKERLTAAIRDRKKEKA